MKNPNAAPGLSSIVLGPGTMVVDIPINGCGHICTIQKLGSVSRTIEDLYKVGSKVAIRRSNSQAYLGTFRDETVTPPAHYDRYIIMPRQILATIVDGGEE